MKSRRVRLLLFALCGAAVLPWLAGAESPFRLRPPLRVDRDGRPIPMPREREVSDLYAIVYNSWLRHLSPSPKEARKQPALNVNAWDEVPDSSWFTNRIGLRPMRLEEIVDSLEGAPPQPPPWTVIRRNDSGYTPKVDIRDKSGRSYVLKFDPKGARERNSGAERIGTLIMHAAGYNVPHNTIAYFRPDDLALDGKSYYRDPFGKRHSITPEFLNAALEKLDAMPGGRYRGIASLYLPGSAALGPFVFTGTRPDDPNDIIPHELRRELRGLRVIGSWINHVDIKDAQALDMFHAGSDGRGVVKHHLIDFSATLGAYEWPSAPFRMGHEYMFDGAAMGRSLVTLGLWRRPWEVPGKIQHQEVGYFTSELFDPAGWKPSFPNLAFERMDDADGYWGAKIVTAFSDDLIRGLAEAGEYQRPEVTKYVETTLRERRDAIGQFWLNRVTPLEDFMLSETLLTFRDLGVERGYAPDAVARSRTYRYYAADLGGRRLTPDRVSRSVEIAELPDLASKAVQPQTDRFGRTPLVKIVVQSGRAFPVEIVVGYTRENRDLQVLGWTHAPR